MKKLGKQVAICLLLTAIVWTAALLTDRRKLSEGLVRLHVVANSDTPEDQYVKRQVRDSVLSSLREGLEEITDVEAAKAYLRENLPRIAKTANSVLRSAGVDGEAVVTLCREAFEKREYDTFALPAGVYESLRIVIGTGKGHNWWCVAFPSLCAPATTEAFSETAVSAGFSQSLTDSLTKKYEVRFYLLDALGKLENILFEGEITPCYLDG